MKRNFCIIFLIKLLSLGLSSPINKENENPMENQGLYEGDISGIAHDSKGVSQIPTSSYGKWPGGIVPYIIDDYTYTDVQLQEIYAGMKLIEDQTRIGSKNCIQFIKRTTEATYLRIHAADGCWSYVGRQSYSGAQLLSLKRPTSSSPSSCIYKGIVAHELMHALGFWHEQSRPDRDNYVKIVWENIDPNQQHAFNKYTTNADTLGLPYDYYSIMHYESKAFSINGRDTIIPLQSNVQLSDASKKFSLTPTDVAEIRKYYNCIF